MQLLSVLCSFLKAQGEIHFSYRLNACGPRKVTCWNPKPKCDGIWRRGLWRWLGLAGDWDRCPHERDRRELSHPFHHVRTRQDDDSLWTRKWVLARHLDLGLPTLQNYEKYIFMVSKHPQHVIFCYSSPRWLRQFSCLFQPPHAAHIPWHMASLLHP